MRPESQSFVEEYRRPDKNPDSLWEILQRSRLPTIIRLPQNSQAPAETPFSSNKVNSATKSSVPVQPPAIQTPAKKPTNAPNTFATYEKGEGVKKDSNEAMKWYGLAAAQGNQSAQEALDRLRTRRSSP